MSAGVKIAVRRLEHARDIELPSYQTPGSSGLDLCAAIAAEETLALAPGQTAIVPTGLTLEMPADMEAQIRPRSGLAAKFGITVLNAPGTIDSDYRGEIGVILINHGPVAQTITRGMRIAQIVFQKIEKVRLVEAAALSPSKRGAGGFGSTGHGETKAEAEGEE